MKKFLRTAMRAFVLISFLFVVLWIATNTTNYFDKRSELEKATVPSRSYDLPCTFLVEKNGNNLLRDWIQTVFLKKKSKEILIFRIEGGETSVGFDLLNYSDERAKKYPKVFTRYFYGPLGYYSNNTEEEFSKHYPNSKGPFRLEKNGVYLDISRTRWSWRKDKGFKGEWLYKDLDLEIRASEKKDFSSEKYETLKDATSYESPKFKPFDNIVEAYGSFLGLPFLSANIFLVYLLIIFCVFWLIRGMELLIARIWRSKE